jgi:hypothetical protein
MNMLRPVYLSMLALAVVTPIACNKANFGGKAGKKNGGGDVVPAGGLQDGDALDVSDLEVNQGKDGPKAGDGEVLSKTIELSCDNEQGVVIDVTGPKTPTKPNDKDPEDKDPGEDEDEAKPTECQGSETGFQLAEEGEVVLDKDGKVVGGKDPADGKGAYDPSKGGKPGEGKPLPPGKPIDVPEAAKVITKVKGQFCPKSSRELTVLFVVDFSGSMGRHKPENGGPIEDGNDPQINGSCGRMRAAQAIIGKLKQDRKPGDKINVAMVPFAGGIVTKKIIGVKTLDQFESLVSKDSFCQYVVQGSSFGYDPQNPGGIDGHGGLFGLDSVDSSTNYRAAFTAAGSFLSTVYGRKVVYFVSDGEPTSGGSDPVAAGIEAGRILRDSVDNLTLNALLLGNPGPQAQQVLVQVAGSPDRVRHAEDADELATKILEFGTAGIDEQSGLATLTVEGYPEADLGLKYLEQSQNDQDVWVYETKPFVLLGIPGKEVINLVEVIAKGTDGSVHSSLVKIRYRQ